MRHLIFGGLFALLISSCDSAVTSPGDGLPRWDVTGSVRPFRECNPLYDKSRFKVELVGLGLATVTDTNGLYTFRSLAPGDYRATVSKDGYLTRTTDFVVRLNSAPGIGVLDIYGYSDLETKLTGEWVLTPTTSYVSRDSVFVNEWGERVYITVTSQIPDTIISIESETWLRGQNVTANYQRYAEIDTVDNFGVKPFTSFENRRLYLEGQNSRSLFPSFVHGTLRGKHFLFKLLRVEVAMV